MCSQSKMDLNRQCTFPRNLYKICDLSFLFNSLLISYYLTFRFLFHYCQLALCSETIHTNLFISLQLCQNVSQPITYMYTLLLDIYQ